MAERPCVLVTGVGGRSVGHQILHALQLLGDRYRVVCTDADPFAFGLYQVASRYVVPNAGDDRYLPAMLDVIRREGVQILLPGTEAEIRVLVGARETLAEAGCLLIASPEPVIALCSDKGKLYQWLAEQNIGVPASAGVTEWRDLAARTGYPLVAKPAGASGGSRNVELIADEAEAEDYIARFPGPSHEIVFQEYVGTADSEYTAGVVIGAQGEVIDSIVLHRKLVGLSMGTQRVIGGKNYALSTGYSQGFIIRSAKIQQFCEDLAVRMGMRGPVNIQLRMDGDTPKIFEVHPRFSGTTSIRADAGLNEPDLVIRNHLLGERLGRQDYQSDVAAIRAFQTILVPMSDMAAISGKPLAGE